MATMVTVRNVSQAPVLIGEWYLFPSETRAVASDLVSLTDERLLWVRPAESFGEALEPTPAAEGPALVAGAAPAVGRRRRVER